MSSETLPVTIRPTEKSDLPLIHAWRQNPVVMSYFHDKDETWEEHLAWWDKHPVSYMIIFDGRPIGEVHSSGTHDDSEADVGLSIGDPHLWGMGIGEKALTSFFGILSGFGYSCLTAHVHPKNFRSQKVFSKAGFFLSGMGDNGFFIYRREL